MTAVWQERIEAWSKGWKQYRFLLLTVAVGVLLLLLPTGKTGGGEETTAGDTEEEVFRLDAFERRLEEVLSKVDGAGRVRVVLTLDESGRQVLAQDRQRTGAEAGSATTVTVGAGSGSQAVVPVQTLAPKFRGALVVCPGGGDPRVKLLLLDAVSALTGLGADRISVCQGNQ
jgi:stage III sporulation protein AG